MEMPRTTPGAGGTPLFSSLSQDLRYALRRLGKNPGFTIVALISLALGIGVNSTIWRLIDLLFLQRLPVAGAERLVVVQRLHSAGKPESLFSYPVFRNLQSAEEACGVVFAFTRGFSAVVRPVLNDRVREGGTKAAHLTSSSTAFDGTPETAVAQLVSVSFFGAMHVEAARGRTFQEIEDKVSAGPGVALISYGYWQRRFGGDEKVVGRTIIVNGTPVTIIGVTPRWFFGVLIDLVPDLYLPLSLRDAVHYTDNVQMDGPDYPGMPKWMQPNSKWLEIMALRHPEVGIEKSQSILNALFQSAMIPSMPADGFRQEPVQRIILSSGERGLSRLRKRLAEPLAILMGLASLVLFSVCANLASLLLASADSRRREMVVRLGIGAQRGRLVRQLLTESLLLSGLGAILGVLFGFWGSRVLFLLIADTQLPLQLNSIFDFRVAGFAALVAMGTGLIFGLIPALQATRVDLSWVLKDTGRTLTGGMGRSRAWWRVPCGRILVVTQIGLSLVLLAGAGLFVRSLGNLMSVDIGFNGKDLLQVEINPRVLGVEDEQLLDLYERLQGRIGALPGVRSVGLSYTGLMSTYMIMGNISLPGVDTQHTIQAEEWTVNASLVTPGFFEAVGIPVLLGRGIARQDLKGRAEIAVINETMARKFFPQGQALGRRFGFGGTESNLEVVGIVKDSKYNSLREETPAMLYRPVAQEIDALRFLLVRTEPGAGPMVGQNLRRTIAEVEPGLAVLNVLSMDEQLGRSLSRDRAVAHLASFFGILALLLAAVGLYGLLSYTVARRTREIGLRLALGATNIQVLALILRDIVRILVTGVIIGLAVSHAATRLIASQLYGFGGGDLIALLTAASILAAVCLLSAYLPASRATRVDPMVAMSHE